MFANVGMFIIAAFLLLIIAIIPAMVFQFKHRWIMCKVASVLIVFLLIAALFVPSPEKQALAKTFSPEKLAGAVSPLRLQITDHQKGKTVKGGQLVTANVLLPFNVTGNQLRPTELAALKALKDEYPDCEWFMVFFSNDQRLLDAGHYLGQAEFKDGKVVLSGGVITQKDIASSGGLIRLPTEEDIETAYEFHQISRRLEKEHMDKVDRLYAERRRDEAQALGIKDPAPDDLVFSIIAKKSGLSREEVKRRVHNIFMCYSITQSRPI